MKKFIDISDRTAVNNYLSKLQPNTIPLWGSFTPLQMLEHLVVTIEYTNGKKQTDCTLSKEEAEKRKQYMIYTDAALPLGIKTPRNEDDPAEASFADIQEAIAALNKELDAFEKYFERESATSVHPGFGELNNNEWVIFHGKHFTHHFRQFGLLG